MGKIKVLNGKSQLRLSRRVLPAVLTAAWVLTACHGKVRRFPDDLEEVDNANRPETSGRAPNVSGPNSANSPDRSEGGQQAPGGLDGSRLPSGAQNICSGGGDAGSCPPNSLCSADAGSVCEATCPGCLIEGECVAVDQLDPDTLCRYCDPSRDARAWSPDDGVPCDDGLFCTVDDICSAGACNGIPRDCEDGVSCNGISTCNEATRSCSPDVSGCGSNALCDIQTDSCVSTCAGCVIGGVCLVVGTESSGNPCLVCDPKRSTTTYTAAAGKSCGAGPAGCSQQDTCDGQGSCQPNHLPANSPCGSPVTSACDQPDSCDGNGNCQQRTAGNGTGCDDGAFCTVGDQCQGGQCVPTSNQNCGANRTCNEAVDQCQCQGCQVGNTCIASGATNSSNPCQVCEPSRSTTAYSVNEGAQCGSGATECSGQDTCNAQGQCARNDFAEGMERVRSSV